MQSIFVFLDITKVADLRRKNGYVSRPLGVCHKIYIFFGSFLGDVWLLSFIIVGYVSEILGRRDVFATSLPLSVSIPQKGHPE